MIYAGALVLVWMCITQPSCYARSKHQREFVTKLAIAREKSMFHSTSLDSNDCSVKTKEGECCTFPFLYKGKEQTECVKSKAGNWCGVTYNYDKEKKWGRCEDCSVKTKEGECCKFPFLYKGKEQTECVKSKVGNWCGVTYNYDKEKKWGRCEGSVCSVKTEVGTCCTFPFLHKGVEQTECVKGEAGSWCGVTSNYDEDKKWGWCEGKAPVCRAKTVDGTCCTFPFLYKGTKQTSCVKGEVGSWCGLTSNYDEDKKWGWCEGKGPHPEPSCRDNMGAEYCGTMKDLNMCKNNRILMMVHCARTCGLCDLFLIGVKWFSMVLLTFTEPCNG